MSSKLTRIIASGCGVLGVVMLTTHFFVPAGAPNDSASVTRIAAFAREHHSSILMSAWLQVAGATLYVFFALAIVEFANAASRLAGRITLLAGTVLVTLTLIDTALIISSVEAARHDHADTLRVSFDLIAGPMNDAIGRSFLIAPAILLPLGVVLLQSRLLPRAYGFVAVALGALSQIVGLAGLFSQAIFADIAPAGLALENLWLIAVAISLIRAAPSECDRARLQAPGGAAP
jgi:hypothetical protein